MTIYDIAKEAKVSISTVSRVINDKGNVDPKLKKRVDNVLKKHSYQPNAIARGLATRSLKTVGVVLPDIRDSHYASIAYRIEQELNRLDFNVIICNVGAVEELSVSLSMLRKRSVDGIILVGSPFVTKNARDAVLAIADELPIVYANGHFEAEKIGSVVIDMDAGLDQAISHLHDSGHRHIGFVRLNDKFSSRKKEGCFHHAAKRHEGLVPSSRHFGPENLESDLEEYLKSISREKGAVSALIFESDLSARFGIKALEVLGLNVPNDISVIGINNSQYCEICFPELTSVDNKLEDIGFRAAMMIHESIGNQQAIEHLIIEPELRVRKSTKSICSHQKGLS